MCIRAQYGDMSKKAECMGSRWQASHIGFAADVCCDPIRAVEKTSISKKIVTKRDKWYCLKIF